jgi:TM2 domain-containing membrane protein YozV
MSDSPQYPLRWRGRQSGPHPLSEINRLLDDHEIGMEHEILYQDQWISLEEFFSALRKAAAPAPPPPKPPLPTIAQAPPPAPLPREKTSPLRIKLSVTPTPEAAPGPARAGAAVGRPRYRLLFALLAVFAGFSGAHNFYARHWLTGLLQLLLSVATALMGFGIIAPWLWAMVEAVAVRKDGRGLDMI